VPKGSADRKERVVEEECAHLHSRYCCPEEQLAGEHHLPLVSHVGRDSSPRNSRLHEVLSLCYVWHQRQVEFSSSRVINDICFQRHLLVHFQPENAYSVSGTLCTQGKGLVTGRKANPQWRTVDLLSTSLETEGTR
jgi:hypothetical protein